MTEVPAQLRAEEGLGSSRDRSGAIIADLLENLDTQWSLDYSTVSNEEDVINAVKTARQEKFLLRCIGSQHSYLPRIEKEHRYIKLNDDLRKIESYHEEGDELIVRVGAGMNIDVDPNDGDSKKENSFVRLIDKIGEGYALPITGGITTQTLGGFISTGSAGGSLTHELSEVIDTIEFVNGLGEKKTASRSTDLWSAVGVSMGMFGIITYITFRLPKKFYVAGKQQNLTFEKSNIGPDEHKLYETLKSNEYFRVNWFPQKGVTRVTEWNGKRVPPKGNIQPFTNPMGHRVVALMASVAMGYTATFPNDHKFTQCELKQQAVLLKLFVPVEGELCYERYGHQEFKDVWYNILPMDNAIDYRLFPVEFTEIWLPINSCQKVMHKLKELFKNDFAAGNFAVEIYSAKKSDFWLSMSYGGDKVRVDPYWNKSNEVLGNQTPLAYFSYFWKTLMDIKGCRLHWGKVMPTAGQEVIPNKVTYDLAYLKSVYPKLEKWLELRKEHDPDNIFLTPYWAKYFGIDTTEKQN